jgi:hypothetical protein
MVYIPHKYMSLIDSMEFIASFTAINAVLKNNPNSLHYISLIIKTPYQSECFPPISLSKIRPYNSANRMNMEVRGLFIRFDLQHC